MADTNFVAETNILTIFRGDEVFPLAQDPAGTPVDGVTDLDKLLNAWVAMPDGAMLNGKIAVTVASNNLTVALKTRAGNNPSTTEPVWVKINGTWRKVTAALSVTKNAGTNWCNAGSTEVATNEVDYFAYLLWNTTPATDIVDIGFSRIPYGAVYSDFSTTTTNEKYLAYGNASQPTSTDDVINIGRFAATLSAGAGYTWTVPTFTSANLKQRPTFNTRWLAYTPQVDQGVSTNIAKTVSKASYQVTNRTMSFVIRLDMTAAGTAGSNVTVTIPLSSVYYYYNIVGDGAYVDSGSASYQCLLTMANVANKFLLSPCSITTPGANVGSNPNIAVASGDAITGTATIEI